MGATRRQFLARGAGATGALALASWTTAVPAGAATGATTLAAGRQRTYQALVEAVAPEAPFRLDAGVAAGAAEEFAAAYAGWSPAQRERADGVLDALGAPFARAQRGRRARWLADNGRVQTSAPTGVERDRVAMAEQALSLVAVTLGPDDDGRLAVTV